MTKKYRQLCLILGDQLNSGHSWYKHRQQDRLFVMMECLSETSYVRHHIQKIVGFFLAMRAFADRLREQGHEVYYLTLDDKENRQSIPDNILMLIDRYGIGRFAYQMPDEYRLDRTLTELCDKLEIETEVCDSEHFLSSRDEVAKLFAGKKQYLMETFYREMRRRHGILMEADGEQPLTGRWNYDQENRRKLPQKVDIPEPLSFSRNVEAMLAMIRSKNVETMGSISVTDFPWPVTRTECLQLLDHFLENSLANFGAYQDAMTDRGELLFHSRLSFGLNTKMIHPLEVVQKSLAFWKERRSEIDIAQIEGFVRQIIGWREYMRGIYWARMPDFARLNFFQHDAALPGFYWTADTRMRCLQQAIGQSLETAYAHHIQRLMVTGNFALLLGVHPDEVDEWYLGIYMDAIEWVEITNTRGMSQFADGGIVGTKPYVSSANYVNKMSDYCGNCHYKHTKKYGEGACPFNSLYWDFYDRHRNLLTDNPRVGMIYRLWDGMDGAEQEKILQQAAAYKDAVNSL